MFLSALRFAFACGLAAVVSLPAQNQELTGEARRVSWGSDLEVVAATAHSAGQPLLVFFTASWCQPCKQMLAGACATAEFAAAFAGHAFALVDIDQHKELAKSWQVGPIPDLRFVTASGEEIGGFVGGRDLAGILAERDRALASGRQAEVLRAAIAAEPKAAGLRLALAEHLLLRPNKRPGIDALQPVIGLDKEHGGLAARAHWLAVAHRAQVLGRMELATAQDAEERRKVLLRSRHPDAATYADAIESMLLWAKVMQAWGEERHNSGEKDRPLVVAADAPLRRVLTRLLKLAEEPGQVAADAAADAMVIDGLLHYYSGDHEVAVRRLDAFTRAFPQHRWHGEGLRFLAINQRILRQREAKR
jgi:thiol-disulfide isomerase/thioredoxin